MGNGRKEKGKEMQTGLRKPWNQSNDQLERNGWKSINGKWEKGKRKRKANRY